MASTIRGVGGEIKQAWYVAARLREFTIAGHSLTGTIDTKDDYRVSQRPLVFVIPARGWRWAVDSLQIEGGTLTAVLVPLE